MFSSTVAAWKTPYGSFWSIYKGDLCLKKTKMDAINEVKIIQDSEALKEVFPIELAWN